MDAKLRAGKPANGFFRVRSRDATEEDVTGTTCQGAKSLGQDSQGGMVERVLPEGKDGTQATNCRFQQGGRGEGGATLTRGNTVNSLQTPWGRQRRRSEVFLIETIIFK